MRRVRRILSALLAGALLAGAGLAAAGCKDDKAPAEAKKDEVAWPQKPADGAPVVAEFLEMTGEGDGLGARVRLFNFDERTVTRLSTRLHYLDEAGQEIKDFPFAIVDSIKGGEHETVEVGAFVPPETKTVRVEVRKVKFAEGEPWQAAAQPDSGEPAEPDSPPPPPQ